MPTMRLQQRLVYQPAMYQHLIDISPSPSNMLEFCLGTLAEMTEGDLYGAVFRPEANCLYPFPQCLRQSATLPRDFIDNGDVDMLRILAALHKNGFDGVLIPDHSPQMSCSAPWHAAMAHTLGFMRVALRGLEHKNADFRVGTAVPKQFGKD